MKGEPILWRATRRERKLRSPLLQRDTSYFWKQHTYKLCRVGESNVVLEDLDAPGTIVHMSIQKWLTYAEIIKL